MTTSLSEYIAEANQQRSSFLGQLCWYSVPESVRITTDNLRQALASVGLEGFMPKPPADHDIFRRVCSAQERKRVPTDDPGIYENYLVRSVSRRNRRVVNQIVVEQRNEHNERLAYEPQVHIEYNGAGPSYHWIVSDELRHRADTFLLTRGYFGTDVPLIVTADDKPTWLTTHDWPVVAADDAFLLQESQDHRRMLVALRTVNNQAMNVAELIERDFYAERNTFNSYVLRELIRTVLEDSYATAVRRGVYFVMAEHAGRMNSLEVLQTALGIEIHSLPLIDSKKQRDMLKKAFEAETVGAIDSLMAEIDNIDTCSTRRYAEILTEMKDLKSRTQQYAELLEDALGEADFRLDIFNKKVTQLLDRVRPENS